MTKHLLNKGCKYSSNSVFRNFDKRGTDLYVNHLWILWNVVFIVLHFIPSQFSLPLSFSLLSCFLFSSYSIFPNYEWIAMTNRWLKTNFWDCDTSLIVNISSRVLEIHLVLKFLLKKRTLRNITEKIIEKS